MLNAARLPAATSTQPGAISASDKAKLDDATWHDRGGTLVQRLSSGQFFAASPSNDGHVATAGWVRANTVVDHGHLGTRNLDSVLEAGVYWANDVDATGGRNYPLASAAGALTVTNTGAGWRRQTYERRSTHAAYVRFYSASAGTWTDWKLAYS